MSESSPKAEISSNPNKGSETSENEVSPIEHTHRGDTYAQLSRIHTEIEELKGKILSLMEVSQPHFIKTSTEVSTIEEEVKGLDQKLEELERVFLTELNLSPSSLENFQSITASPSINQTIFNASPSQSLDLSTGLILLEEKRHHQKQLETLREVHKFISNLCDLQSTFTAFDKFMEAHALDIASEQCKKSGELLTSLSSSKSFTEEPRIMQDVKLDYFQRRGSLIACLDECITQIFIFKPGQIVIHQMISPNPSIGFLPLDEALLQPQLTVSDILHSFQLLNILEKKLKCIADLFIRSVLHPLFKATQNLIIHNTSDIRLPIKWKGDIQKENTNLRPNSACWTWVEDVVHFPKKNNKKTQIFELEENYEPFDPHVLILPVLRSIIQFIYDYVFVGLVDSTHCFGKYIWSWLSNQLLHVLPTPSKVGEEQLKHFETFFLSLQFITNSELRVQQFIDQNYKSLHALQRSSYLEKARNLLLSSYPTSIQIENTYEKSYNHENVLNVNNRLRTPFNESQDLMAHNLNFLNHPAQPSTLAYNPDINKSHTQELSVVRSHENFGPASTSFTNSHHLKGTNTNPSFSFTPHSLRSSKKNFEIGKEVRSSAEWVNLLYYEGMGDYLSFPRCCVSSAVHDFVLILDELLLEADKRATKERKHLDEENLKSMPTNGINSDIKDSWKYQDSIESSWEPSAKSFLLLVRELASLFIIIRPTSQKALILTDPYHAALFFTDCSFIAHKLITIPFHYSNAFKSAAFSQFGFYLDLILALRKLQEANLSNIINTLKQHIYTQLTSSLCFTQLNQHLIFQQSYNTLLDVLNTLNSVSTLWKDVLPKMIFIESTALLMNNVLKYCKEEVLSLTSISTQEAEGLKSLLRSFLPHLGLFLDQFLPSNDPNRYLKDLLIHYEALQLIFEILQGPLSNLIKLKNNLTNTFTSDELLQLLSLNTNLECPVETAITHLC